MEKVVVRGEAEDSAMETGSRGVVISASGDGHTSWVISFIRDDEPNRPGMRRYFPKNWTIDDSKKYKYIGGELRLTDEDKEYSLSCKLVLGESPEKADLLIEDVNGRINCDDDQLLNCYEWDGTIIVPIGNKAHIKRVERFSNQIVALAMSAYRDRAKVAPSADRRSANPYSGSRASSFDRKNSRVHRPGEVV
jgi:hypothetical protein